MADATPSVTGQARESLARGLIGITERIENTWVGYAQDSRIYPLSVDSVTGEASCGCGQEYPCRHLVAFAMLLLRNGMTAAEPGAGKNAMAKEERRTGESKSLIHRDPGAKSEASPEHPPGGKSLSAKSKSTAKSGKDPESHSTGKAAIREQGKSKKPRLKDPEVSSGKREPGLLLSFRLNEQSEKLRLSPTLATGAANLGERLDSNHAALWDSLKENYAFPYEIPLSESRHWQDLDPPVRIQDLNGRELLFRGILEAKPVLRGFSNRTDPRRVLIPGVIQGDTERWLKPDQTSLIEPGGISRNRSFWIIDYSAIESGLSSRMHSVMSAREILQARDGFLEAGVQGLEPFLQVCAAGPVLRISLDYSIDTDLWLHGSVDLVYAANSRAFVPDYMEDQPDAKVQRPVYRPDANLASVPINPESLFRAVNIESDPEYSMSEEGLLVMRNPQQEYARIQEFNELYSLLESESFFQDATFLLNGEDLHYFLTTALPALMESGIIVDFDRELARLFRAAPRTRLNIEKPSGIDWFQGSLTLPGVSQEEQNRIYDAYLDGRAYVEFKDRWIYIPDTGLAELAEMLLDLGLELNSRGEVDLRKSHWMALQSEMGEQLQTRARTEKMRNLEEVTLAKGISSVFKGKLRPYQKRGVEFLSRLFSMGVGGLLADEMGLGKTVQTLAFLQKLRDSKVKGLMLVVCPVSALSVWAQEAQRFTPELPLQIWHGPDRKKLKMPDEGILLTTYSTLSRDLTALKKTGYAVAIVDEAQNLRNSQSGIARAIRRLEVRSIYCLTGTPLENHLMDFWSLMDLSVPGLLGTRQSFSRRFDANPDRVTFLRKLTAPFLLRRTKSEVIKELPEKTEIQSFLPMERRQRIVYESVRQEAMDHLQSAGKEYLMRMLPYLMRLRRIACHPDTGNNPEPLESGKFQYLKDLVTDMADCGSSVLIFSQFTDVLDIAARLLNSLDLSYFRIDGSTSQKNRQKQVQQFQEGERPFFLISLKAGGTALTLHRADRIIHLDPWWNPAAEDQATDRAHRIGQNRNLFVYKLYSKDTVEERVLELQKKKKELFNSVFTLEDARDLKISRAEILNILQ